MCVGDGRPLSDLFTIAGHGARLPTDRQNGSPLNGRYLLPASSAVVQLQTLKSGAKALRCTRRGSTTAVSRWNRRHQLAVYAARHNVRSFGCLNLMFYLSLLTCPRLFSIMV